GASSLRTDTALKLMREIKFDVIRGNASEIKTLALGSGTTHGVDADKADAVSDENLAFMAGFVRDFARSTGAVIALTGAIDLVADSETCYAIRNGRPEMGRITGTGCMLSGIMAGFVAANPGNVLEACASSVCMMGLAGEIGYSHLQAHEGNSSYRNRIIDAIYNMTGEILDGGAKYEVIR
ncbi:MAG: hydroxyethylthiazole kinase, partial [Synergistaceae bacterium]|nr:hydroxyethylthiazole kinase [Synergistaceae bacterium]